jgi:hypothetical protein
VAPKTTKQILIENLFKWGIGSLFGAYILWIWNASNTKQQQLFEKLVTGTVETQQSLSKSVGQLSSSVEELNTTMGESFEVSDKNQKLMTITLGKLDESVLILANCAEETKGFQENVTQEHEKHRESNSQEHQEQMKKLGEIEGKVSN